MMARASGVGARRQAPALRFLLVYLLIWIAVRLLANWQPAVAIPAPPPSPWPLATGQDEAWPREVAAAAPLATAATAPPHRPSVPASSPSSVEIAADPGRHGLRLALMNRAFAAWPDSATRSAVPRRDRGWLTRPTPAVLGGGALFWMQVDHGDGWSLSSWLFLRPGSAAAPRPFAGAGPLGGSQAGARLAYGFDSGRRLSAYGRATIALGRPSERELAFGLAYAPSPRWPVAVAVEQRVAAGRDGRTALAAMVSGGVGDVALPSGFRLEAYGQAGVVGAHRRDGFADGALVVDRPLGSGAPSPLRLGALAAGAVQPGAARVDVGPRLTLRLPEVGRGSRIALDWRQRVAGDARPASGLALTLAADF